MGSLSPRRVACRVRLATAGSLALAALVASSVAGAFCRTTTVAAAADFNPAKEGGCFEGVDKFGKPGVPLFWRNACIGYNVHDPPSRRVSYEDATNALSIAFTRWSGVSCPTDGTGRSRTSIDVRDLGPAGCGLVEYHNGVKNQNVILFRDDVWTHGPQVLGLTIVQFAAETGEILGADMEMNTKDMDPIAFRDPVDPQAYDFLAVVTHEAGHFLGLGHSPDKDSTMYASYPKGDTHQRNLSRDDVNAVCEVYRPDGYRAVLNDKQYQAPGCDPTPLGGFTRDCADASAKKLCAVGPTPGHTVSSGAGLALLAAVGIYAARRARRRAA